MDKKRIFMEKKDWISRIDAVTAAFQRELGPLAPENLNLKPNSQSWCIAQILQHLILVNSSYFPVIVALKEKKYALPVIGRLRFLVNWMGKFILSSVQPSESKKIRTFPVWDPEETPAPLDVLAQFVQNQEALKAAIAGAEGLIREGAVISSPANRYVVYTLETAFEIIVAHEERHLAQALDILSQLKNRA